MIDPVQQLSTSVCPAPLAELYRQCVCCDQEAFEFVLAYHEQAHFVDDMVDGDWDGESGSKLPHSKAAWCERVLEMNRREQVLWRMPFYRRHEAALQVVSCLVRSMYANSEAWKHGEHAGLKTLADGLRFAGNLMIEACALLTGGYQHQRDVSAILWRLSWDGHHDGDGIPK